MISIQFTWCQVRSVAPWQQNLQQNSWCTSGKADLWQENWAKKNHNSNNFWGAIESLQRLYKSETRPWFFCGLDVRFFFEGSPGGCSPFPKAVDPVLGVFPLPGFVFLSGVAYRIPKLSEPRFVVTFCSNPFCIPQKRHLMGILAKIHLAGPIFGQCDNSRHFDIPLFPRLMGFASTFLYSLGHESRW